MPKAYFFKEIASNPYNIEGKPVQFQPIPGNRGLLELESPKDDTLITALNDAATKQVGGIVRLSETQFAEKKSLAASMPLLPPRQKEMLRARPKGPFNKPRGQEPGAAAPANPTPVAPRPEPLPFTRAAQALQTDPSSPDPAADLISQLADATAAPGATESTPITEGFRPATRRISRKGKDSVPAA